MKAFMDKEFMLQSPTAQHLYHAYAEDMPICDYHCHIPPREIYENRRFDNIAQVWLGGRNPDGSYFGDHYKWRVMRSNGVPEEYITGDTCLCRWHQGIEIVNGYFKAVKERKLGQLANEPLKNYLSFISTVTK